MLKGRAAGTLDPVKPEALLGPCWHIFRSRASFFRSWPSLGRLLVVCCSSWSFFWRFGSLRVENGGRNSPCWGHVGTMLAHFSLFGCSCIKIALIGGNHSKNCGFQALRNSNNRLKLALGLSWPCLGLSWPVLSLSWYVLACLEPVLTLSWVCLGPVLACLGPVLVLSWAVLACLGPVLGVSWVCLGLSWPVLGLSWPLLGLSWACLGALLACHGPVLSRPGPVLH